MDSARDEVPPGVYQHFKGGLYEVLGVARHVDSPEEFVVYRALYGDNALYVRPKVAFLQPVASGNGEMIRFVLVDHETNGRALAHSAACTK